MDPRKAGGVTIVVGVLVTAVPFVWDSVPEQVRDSTLGTTFEILLNPGALAGGLMAPDYPVGLGMVAIGIGLSLMMIDEIEIDPWKLTTIGAGGGAFFGMFLALGTIQGNGLETARMTLLGAAPGFAAVVGAANERTHRLVGFGLIGLTLSPCGGWLLSFTATAGGWGRSVATTFLLILLLYTSVYAFPFLRLGRGLQKDRFRGPYRTQL